MEFRQALRDLVVGKNMRLTDDAFDKAVLVAFGSYCASNSEMLQLQELKNILSTGTPLGYALLKAYLQSKKEGDSSYKALADKIEAIADELERNNISCFSYAYFISCYLDLFKEIFRDDDFIKLDIDSIEWIDPEKYDYGYQSMPTAEKTFGFGRYRASIKEFNIENGMLKEYTGRDPYVVIPYFVKSIGNGAFAENKKIKSVYIPRSVSKIGAEAFSGCEKLETVVLSDNITRLCSATFEKCKLLKRINLGNIVSVGNRCFKDCIKLENIDMPALTKVGDEAFSCCISLKNTGFVSNLNQIGSKAFERCSMNYVSLESCSKLASQAFLNCTSLTRIALNSNIASIGVAPFKGCAAVSLLNIAGDSYNGYIHDLFSDNFDDFNQQITELRCIKKDFIKNSEFSGYRCIQEVEIRSTDVIPEHAFENCGTLTAVKFGQPIKAIGRSAFAYCKLLTDIDMDFVGEEIADKAFYGCERLNIMPLLNNVSVVGNFACAYTDLSSYSFSKTFKKIGAFAFANAKFPAKVSLDFSECEVLPGAFHGVTEILMLKIDSTFALYKGKLYLLFDSNLSDFTAKRKINYLFVSGTISAQAFKDYSNIRYIEFEAAEGKVPSEAFANCTALESVKINGDVSLIEPCAFSDCVSLSALDMHCDKLTVGRKAFSGCKHAGSIVNLKKITRFGEYSFSGTDISELSFGDDVQYIGKSAFSLCSDIENVSIPFVGCLPEGGDGEERYFGAIFGTEEYGSGNVQRIVNNKDEIRYYIPGNIKSITVLSESLNEDCFDGCGFLTELYLPNIVDFKVSCFKNCSNLRFIYLGKTLDSFSAEAIVGCEKTVKLDIAAECEKYTAVNGTVMSKNKDKLYFLAFDDKLADYLSGIREIGTYAVARAPAVIDLPSTIETVESYAFDCTGTKSISVDSVKNIMPSAFYNCDVLENITVNNIIAGKGMFVFGNIKPTLNRVSLSNVEIDSFSELFGGECNILSLNIRNAEIHSDEFKGKNIDKLNLEGIKAIRASAFSGANIGKLSISGVEYIESGAFTESHIDEMFVDDERYRLVDGILYCEDELIYCFDKKMQKLLVPSFVKRVAAGAIDSLTELRQLSVLHSDVMFEFGAVVNCTNLNTVELVQISNEVLSDLFDTVNSISFIKYTGKTIKRKFFSHMDSVREVQLDGVSEIGDLAFCECTSIEIIKGLNDVDYVGDMAFAYCKALKYVILRASCSWIGIGAFEGCYSLIRAVYPIGSRQVEFDIKAVDLFGEKRSPSLTVEIVGGDIPDLYFKGFDSNIIVTSSPKLIGNKAFKESGLTQISLDGTVKIGAAAFSRSQIQSAFMPYVTHIEPMAFSYCSLLKSVVINNSVEQLGENWLLASPIATLSGAEFGEHYRTVSNYLVEQSNSTLVYAAPDSSIRELTIDEGVKRISAAAFSGSNVLSVDAGAVSDIEEASFENCRYLESLVLPELSYGNGNVELSFYLKRNRNIKSVVIHRGELAEACFASFDKLETVTLPQGIKLIPQECFSGCKALSDISLDCIASIGEKAFFECESLKQISLLSIDTLGVSSFENCKSLKAVKLSDSLLKIPERAFAGCTALRDINIPKQLTEIGTRAFAETAMKKCILIMPYSLVTVGEYIFENADSPVIYVDRRQTSTWNADWGMNCKGHGLFYRSNKVITKKL